LWLSAYTENSVAASAPLLGLTIASASTLGAIIDSGGTTIQFPAGLSSGRFLIVAYWLLEQDSVDDEQFTTGYSTPPTLVNCTAPGVFDALSPQQWLLGYVYATGLHGGQTTLPFITYVDITGPNASVALVGCQWGW